jgi:transposase
MKDNEYAKIIDTIPGIDKFGALSMAVEIGDVERLPRYVNIFSYASLVPRIYRSRHRRKGYITKGNGFLKYILVDCVQSHICTCPYSEITEAYRRISIRSGSNKAKIAAARHQLRMI